MYYNIPRKIRELQSQTCQLIDGAIITYQEKLGNYNKKLNKSEKNNIITYQEKLGNYNV